MWGSGVVLWLWGDANKIRWREELAWQTSITRVSRNVRDKI